MEERKLWTLKRCLYGLSDAPRARYSKVEEKLTELDGKVSFWHDDVMTEVMKEFKISKKEQGSFKYIGLNIEQTDKAIFVDQMEYVKSFKEINISAERKNKINDALDETEKKQLRSLCGELLWVT
eukprot:gene6697-7458_t